MSENLGLNLGVKVEKAIQILRKKSTSVKMCGVAFCPADGANDGLISDLFALIHLPSERDRISEFLTTIQ